MLTDWVQLDLLPMSVAETYNIFFSLFQLETKSTFYKQYWPHMVSTHRMAMGNPNKSKETIQTATTALKLEHHYPQKLKSSLLDRNLPSRSTSECEDCAARFTSWETVFENFIK